MSTAFKNKLLTGLVILLLLANLTTIVVFWTGMKKMTPVSAIQQPSEFLVKKLSFNDNQQDQYKALVKQHREQTRIIREAMRSAKDSFFELLSHKNVNDNIKNNLLEQTALLNRQLDNLTFDHFKEVRMICDPVQQQKFDKIIKDVLRIMSGPGPRGNRPPPHEQTGTRPDGPPPTTE